MEHKEVNLDPHQLVLAVVENLDALFFASNRDDAKLTYQSIIKGNQVPMMRFDMSEGHEVICELALDTTEYVGKMNFGRFRKGLAMMLLGMKNRLDKEQELNMMESQDGEMLFNIPGVLQSDDGTNVLVCGLRQLTAGQLIIRLMYLKPDGYAEAAIAGREKFEEQERAKEKGEA